MRRAAIRARRTGVLLAAVLPLVGATGVRADEEVMTQDFPLAQRGDRIWPTQESISERIDGAFSLYPKVVVERRDEAATRNGRVTPETVATPPEPVIAEPVRGPEAAEGRFDPRAEKPPAAMAVALALPKPRPLEAIERAMGPSIVVSLPRKRPKPPTVFEEDGTVEAPESTNTRIAALAPIEGLSPPSAREETTEAPILAEGQMGEPRRIPKEALPYLAILRREAAANKVPLWLAIGVGWVESKYNPGLRGTHGVVGIMQVMPSTARFQGYKGSNDQLLDPETNIVWGMRELGWDWAQAKGNPCLAVAKYKGGIMTRTIPSAAASYCQAAKRATGMI